MAANAFIRLHCSYKVATIILCACNVIGTLFLLQSFIYPLFYNTPSRVEFVQQSSLPAVRYTDIQLSRMKEALAVWKAAEPVELIKRVKEIQAESVATYGSKPTEVVQASGASDLAQRLKELRTTTAKSDQEALEEWRRKKLEEARKRSQALKAQQEEYIT